ncbi:MAG: hypothetical protein Q9226_003320 [Calogaya cf. arnoldii]
MANTKSICTAAASYLADNFAPYIIGPLTVLTFLAVVAVILRFLAVILRFLARSLTTAPYGVDDWLILFALVWECALSTVQFLDTTVSAGTWLNVELSIGILSAGLPPMRSLISRAIPSQIRSRFSKSRRTGSHRLQDVEGLNAGKHSSPRALHSKSLSDSGIYQGQNKQQPHKSWYNSGAHISSKTTGRHSEEGSEEDMVPMGKIQVRHSLEWEQKRGPGSVSQGDGTPDTLG